MTNKDVSRQTVVILAVLVVVFSVLGTLTVMNEVASAQTSDGQEELSPTAQGTVSMGINSPPEPVETQGQVSINIVQDQNGG